MEKEREKEWIRRLDKNYNWATKAAVRENAKGRAKGGVIVGIKKSIFTKSVKEWEYGLVLREVNIERGKIINVIITYNNEKMKEVAVELKELYEELMVEGNSIIILGDFNARIGKWRIDEEGELVENRSSADDTLNAEGKRLLELCEIIGGTIKNGDTRGDWEGKQTYVGGEGCSVLDLVIEIENEKGSIVDELKVENRIESDHLPVEVLIGRESIGKRGEKKGRKKVYRLKWDSELKEKYTSEMRERALELESEGKNVQEKWDRLVKIIWEVGKKLKVIREQGGEEGEERDGDIKAQKRRVWTALKKWCNSRDEGDKAELREEKKRLKEIRKIKVEEGRAKKKGEVRE